ncbi:hypothetical protein JR316_0007630 [Psilocybe cubensis]|uniref:Uncharacterized protein n=1 Tax=Psilocybe cubensis TaxID=181762 RepID=A0ACB8GUB1_PSICU|nr:hypothetical protein JR316_0007630 [Psilocybe cubensis]KAH9479054.1 hypothetical protein JR316_0007630 [Psilocybe cubensis]
MAQYQEESFVIPSNTFLPGYFSSMFESELAPESLLDQFLAQNSDDNTALHQFQRGPSTVEALSDSYFPISTSLSGFDRQSVGEKPVSPYPPTTRSSTYAPTFHPGAIEGEGQLFDPWYPPYPYTEEGLLGQNSWRASTRLIVANKPRPGETLGSTPGPSILCDNSRHFTPQASFQNSSNEYTNDYQTFPDTIGEGLGIHNTISTGEQQPVEDQCSRDHPVEHDHSERNAHGSGVQRDLRDSTYSSLYGLNNALEWPPRAYESLEEEVPHTNAGIWTDESISPKQPAPNTSQLQGHVPSCMGGLGVSVTRERKRRKEKGFRFVNLAVS